MGYEIDFLPVGGGERSGDAIALRFGNLHGSRREQTVVVVDGGFQANGEELVEHIGKHYGTDRVDLVVSTHPDADHTSGLLVVLEEMQVDRLWMHQPWDHTDDIARMFKDGRVTDNSVREALQKSLESARELERFALSKGIPIKEPFQGVVDTTGCLQVVAPTSDYYESLLPGFRGTPEPKDESLLGRGLQKAADFVKMLRESLDIETLDDDGETSPENNTSAILLLSIGDRRALLTGDAGIPALNKAADYVDKYCCSLPSPELKFLQVPHHGSKRNVGPTLLNRLLGPKLGEDKYLRTAYVSASKDGNPKHPAKRVTNAYRRRGAPVHATQGILKWHYHEAPDREGFSASTALPLYNEVEE